MQIRGSLNKRLARMEDAYDLTCDYCRRVLDMGREVLRVVDDFEHQFCCQACADRFEARARKQ